MRDIVLAALAQLDTAMESGCSMDERAELVRRYLAIDSRWNQRDEAFEQEDEGAFWPEGVLCMSGLNVHIESYNPSRYFQP